MKIHFTVVFPQTFEMEIPDVYDVDEQKELIKDYARYLMETSQSDPIIIDCDAGDFID